MKSEDCFLGQTFRTPTGSTLTVVGKVTSNWRVKYEVKCSSCSEDRELFPDKLLISKAHLLNWKITLWLF